MRFLTRSDHVDVDGVVLAEPGEHVEPPAAAGALLAVVRFRSRLEFVEHEGGHHEAALEHARLGEVGDPAVDDGGGVEHVGAEAADVAGELNVGDQESEVVAGLNQQARAEVAQHAAQDEREPGVERVVGAQRQDRLEGEEGDVGDEHADQQPEVHGRDRRQILAADHAVETDDRERQHDHAGEDRPRHPRRRGLNRR